MTNPIRRFLTAALLLATCSPSMADSVSGYAKAHDGNLVKFELTIDASDAAAAPSGSIQYRRGNSATKAILDVDATVSCMWLSADGTRAVAAGPARVNQNPGNDYVNEWFFGAVQKVPGDLERVRAGFISGSAGQAMCQNGESLFPGVVLSGGYVIERSSNAQTGSGSSASSTSNIACNAYFKFDDTLADASPNAYDGEMFGAKGGSATPVFSEGQFGQALVLNGSAAMRALLDLNYDLCPQVTLSAWIKLARDAPGDKNLHLLSTGGGASPGLTISGTGLHLLGTENGILKPNAIRKGSWLFVAGVYDYSKGEYALYSGGSTSVPGVLSPYRADPQNAFWVGTVHDDWGTFAGGIAIDDLKITGRALSSDQIAVLRSTKPAPSDPSSTATKRPTSVAPTLPACNAKADCATGTYCAVDKSCHPDFHLPMGATELELAPVPIRTITPADVAAASNPASESGDDEIVLRDLPEDLGIAAGGAGMDPELTVLGDQPGSDDIQSEFEYRPPATRHDLEVYRRNSDGPIETIDIVLPGTSVLQTITYENVDGVAVAEGDIILGNVSELAEWQDAAELEVSSGIPGTRRQGLNAVKNTKYLWPGGEIPYTFHSNMTAASIGLATAAGKDLTDMTNLVVFPRAGEDNYVEFKMKDNDDDACSSIVGMKQSKGGQTIKVDPDCSKTVLIHEILHAAGFWHEQSRPDRDQYVEILLDNVTPKRRSNFKKKSADDATTVGPYNYKSVMHYGEFNFGKDCIPVGAAPADNAEVDCIRTAPGEAQSRTLRAIQPGAIIERSLATDVDAINAIYGTSGSYSQGKNWRNGFYATSTAIGDVDGDGRGEIVIGRVAETHSRFLIYDDKVGQHQLLANGPSNWGADVSVTDVAVGDIDGDGRMEIGVTRKSGSGNRFFVYKYNNGQLTQVFQGGDDWGAGNYATSIAFGDIDSDGRDEIAVGRKAGEHGRYYLYNDGAASSPYDRLAIGGSKWDASHYATDVAFGDVNNDGRQDIGVTRFANSGMRYEIVSYSNGSFTQLHSGGHDWGNGNHGTAIAFGNIDNDGGDEIIIGRKAGSDSRFYVDDDQSGAYSRLDSGGDRWGSNYYVVGVDMADVDNDGKDEVIVARNAGENGRYYVYNYFLKKFSEIPVNGGVSYGGVGATDVAAGDVDNDGKADLVVSYDQKVYDRPRFEAIYFNPPAN